MDQMEHFYQQKNQELRFALKQKEREVKSLKQRMDQMEHSYQQEFRFALKQKEREVESFKQRMDQMKHSYQQEFRFALEQKEREVESLKQSQCSSTPQPNTSNMWQFFSSLITGRSGTGSHTDRMDQQERWYLQKYEGVLEQKDREFKHRYTQMEEQYRMTLKAKDEELTSFKDRVNQMKHSYQQELRSALEQKEREVESLKQRMDQMKHSYQQEFRSALEQKEREVESLKQRMDQQERWYLQKYEGVLEQKDREFKHRSTQMEEQYRMTLKAKDEELRSFKDRVAREVSLSIKTGKTESMNSPVNKTRLIEMYGELRQQWPKIKKNLKSNNSNSESVKAEIQKAFKDAADDMKQKKEELDKMFGLKDPSGGPTSEKVKQYRQSTNQNLQLALYHSRTGGASSQMFPSGHGEDKSRDVMESLVSQCYWLGCLLALNNPPLQPHWENHNPGMDRWNILPQDMTVAPVM